MIIYRFSTWTFKKGKIFEAEEIEVEEKPKTYVSKRCRINKNEIGKLSSHYGNEMYLLENKPEIYINAMIEHCKRGVDVAEKNLDAARERLSKWSALAERKQESGQ